MVDYGNQIVKFDKNLNFYSRYSPVGRPNFIISVNYSNKVEVFVSSYYGVFKFNISLSKSISSYCRFNSNQNFRGLYYNQTGDYILACSNTYYIEFLTRDDLTFIK